MSTFAELLTYYMERIGITDTELARKIGVGRQTIFRWKEGLVKSPRKREVVLDLAKAIRLTPDEQDTLLLAAGFAPEILPEVPDTPLPAQVVMGDDSDSGTHEHSSAEDDDTTNAPVNNEPINDDVHSGEEVTQPDTKLPIPAEDSDNAVTVTLPLSSTDPDKAIHTASENIPPLYPGRSVDKQMKWWGWVGGVALLILVISLFTFPSWNGSILTTTPTTVDKLGGLASPSREPPGTPQTPSPPTSSPTPTAVAKPLAFCAPESDDEKLLIAAQFTPFGSTKHNIAGRILEPLEMEITDGKLTTLRVARYRQEITSADQARVLMGECGAAVVIWGEYDDSRVKANITTLIAQENYISEPTSFSELPSFINVDVPSELRVLALETLGLLFRSEKRYSEAITAFNRALEPSEDSPSNVPTEEQRFNLYFYLGHVNYLAGLDTEGIAHFSDSIQAYVRASELTEQLESTPPELPYNRGLAHMARHRLLNKNDRAAELNLAIDALSLALRRKRNYVSAYAMRGNAYLARKEEGDLQRAINDYSAALALDPQAKYYYNRALAHIAIKQYASWEVDLNEALRLKYNQRDVHTLACYAHLRQYELAEAKTACESAMELTKDVQIGDLTYLNYGIVLAASEETEEALTYINQHLAWISKKPGRYIQYDGSQVEEWVVQLVAGKQPFDEAMLVDLE